MTRLAAIIEHDDALEICGEMDPAIMAVIAHEACGPAASMVDYGHIWATLSVWEAFRRMTNNFEGATHGTRYTAVETTGGNLVLQHAKSIHERVVALEALLNLDPATEADLGAELDEAGLLSVQQALADAWFGNIMWIPQGWDPMTKVNVRSWAHSDELYIDDTNEVIVLDGLLDDTGLYATSLGTLKEEGRYLKAWNTILLDGRCLQLIHVQRMGNRGGPRESFASAIAHRGLDDDEDE